MWKLPEDRSSIIGNLDYGSKVTVKGIVTIYKGNYEIKVRAFTDDAVEVIS